MGGRRVEYLQTRLGRESCIGRGGPDKTVEICELEEPKEEVTMFVGVEIFKRSRDAAKKHSLRSESCLKL